LSKIDQDGIAAGRAQVGMTRQGVLYAMGRPPFHANPSLDSSEWMYWRNRFGKTAVQFDESGKVTNVR
jgi:outer membrane protein assembly factor BamE (lipoprotein component of BamABCDE complex)